MEPRGWWVGGQPKHLKARAEGSPYMFVPVPNSVLVGFSS